MSSDVKRLLLGNAIFIDIDENGFLASKPYEGTMGLLLRAKAGEGKDAGYLALKIPRLVADTPQENSHISNLLEEERLNCQTLSTGGGTDTLLDAVNPSYSPLASPAGPAPFPELNHQNSQWVMVNFSPEGVRFVGVKFVDDGGTLSLKFTPAEPEELKGLDPEALKAAIAEAKFGDTVKRPLFIRPPSSLPTDPRSVSQLQETEALTTRTAWYLGLPAIAYRWATRTLEEFVDSLGRADERSASRFDWRQVLQLNLRILGGLRTLHRREFIHGDLRPANIMQIGVSWEAATFYLSDFASFGRVQPIGASSPTPPTDSGSRHTELGPVLPGGRISPFYAPERQSASESESADAALLNLIRHHGGKGVRNSGGADGPLVVLLGWRSDIVKENSGGHELTDIARAAVDRAMKDLESDVEPQEPSASRDLREGDRIRLRELVFEVERTLPSYDAPFEILKCRGPGWVIHQERALIQRRRSLDRQDDPFQLVLLPKVVEIWQWSAATDLYSMGALALYSFFNLDWMRRVRAARPVERPKGPPPMPPEVHGTDHEPREAEAPHSASSSVEQSKPDETPQEDAAVDREELFRTMIETIASTPYAKTIWTDVVELCHDLETVVETRTGISRPRSWQIALATREGGGPWKPYGQHLDDEEVEGRLKRIRDAAAADKSDSSDSASSSKELGKTLLYHTLIGVGRLTQTAPGLDRVLEALDKNAASFLWIVHFALMCMYRGEDVSTARADGAKDPLFTYRPFCRHRAVRPHERDEQSNTLAADRALTRLEQIEVLIEGARSRDYEAFTCGQIIRYKPAPAAFLRLQNADLAGQKAKLEERLRTTVEQIGKLRDEIERSRSGLDRQLRDLPVRWARGVKKTDIEEALSTFDNNLTASLTSMRYIEGNNVGASSTERRADVPASEPSEFVARSRTE